MSIVAPPHPRFTKSSTLSAISESKTGLSSSGCESRSQNCSCSRATRLRCVSLIGPLPGSVMLIAANGSGHVTPQRRRARSCRSGLSWSALAPGARRRCAERSDLARDSDPICVRRSLSTRIYRMLCHDEHRTVSNNEIGIPTLNRLPREAVGGFIAASDSLPPRPQPLPSAVDHDELGVIL